VLSMFFAGACCAFAITAALQGEVSVALFCAVCCALNLWLAWRWGEPSYIQQGAERANNPLRTNNERQTLPPGCTGLDEQPAEAAHGSVRASWLDQSCADRKAEVGEMTTPRFLSLIALALLFWLVFLPVFVQALQWGLTQ